MMFRRFKAFLREQRGSASVEFVIVFPLIFTVFMSTFEAAMLTARHTMLDRGLDKVIREIRLSADAPRTPAEIRKAVCDLAYIIPSCQQAITIEMTDINPPDWSLPNTNVECVDRIRNETPIVTFTQAQANKLVLVRACVVVDPWFPLTGLGLAMKKDASGGYQMYTNAAFVAEP